MGLKSVRLNKTLTKYILFELTGPFFLGLLVFTFVLLMGKVLDLIELVIKKGVDLEAMDQMPTYVILLLLGNKDNPGFQLKVLAHICRLVKETKVVEKIKNAELPSDICSILEEEEDKI